MKIAIIFLFLFCFDQSKSQTINLVTIISDTTVIRTYTEDADTFYVPKRNDSILTWTIYYDKFHKSMASYGVQHKYGWDLRKEWYQSGQIKYYCYPVDSIFKGEFEYRNWFRNGKLKAVRKCYPDSCVSYQYYMSGNLEKKNIDYPDSSVFGSNSSVLGMDWHYTIAYYENGRKKFDSYDPNGKRQTVVSYYSSGVKKNQNDLWKMQKVGPHKEWYENDTLKVDGNYKVPTPAETNNGRNVIGGVKTGKWTYYDESGKKTKEEFYEENKLVKTINY